MRRGDASRGRAGVTLALVPFRPEHAAAFYRLNRHWLDEHGLYEPADEAQMADPQASIIDVGGAIVVAENDGVVVGTAAIVPHGQGEMELAKLTVADSVRGAGLGRRLTESCIALARERGARRLVLVSSSRLASALRLYESMGFTSKPLPPKLPYATADVYMELELGHNP
jgi:ribosomal protein S18 acetylase RimI-like enzyme